VATDDWMRIDEHIASASHVAYQVLRQGILTCRMAPGTRISVADLATRMGVSRTPVRDALQRLETEGLIVTVPRSYTQVSELSITEMNELYAIRILLEGPAAALAAQNITPAHLDRMRQLVVEAEATLRAEDHLALVEHNDLFHRVLFEATGNERLAALMLELRSRCQRYIITFTLGPGRNLAIVEEHKLIIAAMANRDAVRARTLIEDHLRSPWDWLKKQLVKG